MWMSNADVFQSYLQRFTAGDVEGAAEYLIEDFRFEGPLLSANSRADFLAGASQLGPIVRGCKMHRQWVDGDHVCSIYDFKVETPLGAGSIPMAEWSVVRDGQLMSSRLLFDTATMAALMPGG
jgi:hypothetical protein